MHESARIEHTQKLRAFFVIAAMSLMITHIYTNAPMHPAQHEPPNIRTQSAHNCPLYTVLQAASTSAVSASSSEERHCPAACAVPGQLESRASTVYAAINNMLRT